MYALTVGHRSSVNPISRIGKPGELLTEFWIHLGSSLSVLQCFWQSHQLGICVCSVIVSPRVIRIPIDTFRISLNGTSEITLLEQSVSFLPSLRRLLRIDICELLALSLVTFSLAEFVEDIRGSMFCERFVEVLDRRSQIASLGVSGPNTPVSLSDKLVVRSDLGR